jgi:hypothetical protein
MKRRSGFPGLIRRAIKEHLSVAPDERTRNRKPLEDQPGPAGSTWELRCGPGNRFRVFYGVSHEERVVCILAIAVKQRNRLFIAGEELES